MPDSAYLPILITELQLSFLLREERATGPTSKHESAEIQQRAVSGEGVGGCGRLLLTLNSSSEKRDLEADLGAPCASFHADTQGTHVCWSWDLGCLELSPPACLASIGFAKWTDKESLPILMQKNQNICGSGHAPYVEERVMII